MRPVRAGRAWVVAAVAAAALAPGLAAQASITQDEALRLAFPAADSVARRTAFLSDAQLEAAREGAGPGVEVPSGVVTYYVAFLAGEARAVAYFDAHRVRTLPEALMVVVEPGARVRRVEILKFSEPPEYRAPDGWLGQFPGRSLDRALSLKGGIVNITGATLTSGAVTGAVRRVLALHRVIRPLGAGEP